MANVYPTRLLWSMIPYVLIAYLYFYILLLQGRMGQMELLQKVTNQDSVLGQQQQQRLQPRSSSSLISSTLQGLKEKDRDLELKLNAYLGYDSDPFYSTKTPLACKNQTDLRSFCTEHDCDIIPICLDSFPYGNCVIYDFGIREQPHFGVILSKPPFSCQVYAFDPSPISKEFYANNKELKNNKNYKIFHYGGGGADEEITLRQYDWGQVSIYSYPTYVVANPRNCTNSKCRYQKFPPQETFQLPVRSVASIMKEFGHDRVDVLKLDVEGSEYRMLEGLIESGACNHVNQISLEWHHFDYDRRYGYASIPQLNLYTKLLKEKCGIAQFFLHDLTGWPSNEELYIDMQIRLMYNVASFMRIPHGHEMNN